MPYVNSKAVHQIDVPLSNLSVKFANDASAYIADQIFTGLPVAKESDAYYIFGKDSLRLEESIRANGAKANEVTYELSTSTYTLNRHSLKELVTDRERENADEGLDPDISAMENVTEKILLRKEKIASTLLMTTTAGGSSHSLTSTLGWTDLTTISDPIGDVQTATTVIQQSSAKLPNTLVFGYDAFSGLRNHPNILERIKYSERGVVTVDLLKAVFDIDKILIGNAIENTAAEGDPDTLGYVWANHAWVGYVNPQAGLRRVSAGYNFFKKEKNLKVWVKKWRDEDREGDWIEANMMSRPILVATACAYSIKGVA